MTTGTRKTLPEGRYEVRVSRVEQRESRAGNPYRSVTFEVTKGPSAKRLAWANFNLDHPNEKAAQIAGEEWASFCEAAGIEADPSGDGQDAIGKELAIHISHRPGDGGRVWADVDSYEAA